MQLVKSESFLPLLPGMAFEISIGDKFRPCVVVGLVIGEACVSFFSSFESLPASNVMFLFLNAESLAYCLTLMTFPFEAQSLASETA